MLVELLYKSISDKGELVKTTKINKYILVLVQPEVQMR